MSLPERSKDFSTFSLANRDNPYSFDEFLEKLAGFDFYADDPFLQRCVRHYCPKEFPALDEKLRAYSPRVSFRMRQLADHIARKERHPYLEHYDAHNHRIDRIVRPRETQILEEESFSEGFFSEKTSDWESFVKRFVLHQLGEAGVMCPLACTEGLVAIIEAERKP